MNTNFDLDKQFSLYNLDIFICSEAHGRHFGLRSPINSKKDLYRDPEGKKLIKKWTFKKKSCNLVILSHFKKTFILK